MVAVAQEKLSDVFHTINTLQPAQDHQAQMNILHTLLTGTATAFPLARYAFVTLHRCIARAHRTENLEEELYSISNALSVLGVIGNISYNATSGLSFFSFINKKQEWIKLVLLAKQKSLQYKRRMQDIIKSSKDLVATPFQRDRMDRIVELLANTLRTIAFLDNITNPRYDIETLDACKVLSLVHIYEKKNFPRNGN